MSPKRASSYQAARFSYQKACETGPFWKPIPPLPLEERDSLSLSFFSTSVRVHPVPDRDRALQRLPQGGPAMGLRTTRSLDFGLDHSLMCSSLVTVTPSQYVWRANRPNVFCRNTSIRWMLPIRPLHADGGLKVEAASAKRTAE